MTLRLHWSEQALSEIEFAVRAENEQRTEVVMNLIDFIQVSEHEEWDEEGLDLHSIVNKAFKKIF